jgi:ribonuclease P protein component
MRELSLCNIKSISKKKDFQEIFKNGQCIKGSYFNVYIFLTDTENIHLAIIISRKIGKAVIRNKIRRRIRGIIRTRQKEIIKGCRIIIRVKKEIQTLSYQKLQETLEKTLEDIKYKPQRTQRKTTKI